MSVIAADFAWSKPSVSQLKSWGVVAVGMYVSHDSGKNANLAVVEAYAAAGIKSFLFFEDAADRALGGYPAGVSDAAFAHVTGHAYGMPSWAPVAPAMDFDIRDYAPGSTDPLRKLGPVGEYLGAWHDYDAAHGVIADAAYGSYYLIRRATAAGLCQLGIQTIAWSGGQVDLADITLYQNAQALDGGQVDVEVIENAALLTHLAWTPGEPNPLAPPPPAAIAWAQWPAGVTLQYGSTGPAVRVLQAALCNSRIYGVRGIAVNGSFAQQTKVALDNFQAARHLAVDGIAGPLTRAALMALGDV